MDYPGLRHLHVTFAALSLLMFAGRGIQLLRARRVPRLLRWLPHVNDSLLLLAAIGLMLWSGQYPFQQNWLTAKVCALLVYILFGRQALRPGLSVQRRLLWLLAALGSIAYIFAVAVTRRVLPF